MSSLGAKWLDTFSRSLPQPCPALLPRRPPASPACQPPRVVAQGRVDVPVLRVSRLFIIIIAIVDLMSKPNARPRRRYFSIIAEARCYTSRGRERAMFFPRPRRDGGACTARSFISARASGRASEYARESRDFDFLTKSSRTKTRASTYTRIPARVHIISCYGVVNHIEN